MPKPSRLIIKANISKRFAQATEQAFASKSLTPLEAQFISENNAALKLGGNYLVRFQALTAKPYQTEAICHALAKYRTANDALFSRLCQHGRESR